MSAKKGIKFARAEHRKIIGQQNRLKVFSLIKEVIQVEKRFPTIAELQQWTGLCYATVLAHVNALRNATGLSYERFVDDDDLPEAVDSYLLHHGF